MLATSEASLDHRRLTVYAEIRASMVHQRRLTLTKAGWPHCLYDRLSPFDVTAWQLRCPCFEFKVTLSKVRLELEEGEN